MAFEGGWIDDESGRTNITLSCGWVPKSRSIASNTVIEVVQVRGVCWADAAKGSMTEYESFGTVDAGGSFGVPDSGS